MFFQTRGSETKKGSLWVLHKRLKNLVVINRALPPIQIWALSGRLKVRLAIEVLTYAIGIRVEQAKKDMRTVWKLTEVNFGLYFNAFYTKGRVRAELNAN